jgi:hypothetical protein
MPVEDDNASALWENQVILVVTALLALKEGTTERKECLAPATALEQHATALEQHGTRMLKHEYVAKKLETMEKPAFEQNSALEQNNTRIRKQGQVAKQNETREKPALEQNSSVVQNKPCKRKHQQLAENTNIRKKPTLTRKRFRARMVQLLWEQDRLRSEQAYKERMCDRVIISRWSLFGGEDNTRA